MHQTKRQVRRWSVGHDATVAQCVVASPGPPGRMMRRTGADAVLILVSRRRMPHRRRSRTHFAYRIELLNTAGEIQEHLAGRGGLPTQSGHRMCWSPADQLQALRHIC